MNLSIAQDARPAADGQWHWSVWLDGPAEELDRVASVEWVLHPSFAVPIVVVKRRQDNFRLDAGGWGEFEINAQVTTLDGVRHHLRHQLRLTDPEGTSEPPRPAVFVSASLADARWEDAVADALTQRGYEVLTGNDVPSGVPFDTAISSLIDRSSAVVGIFSGKSGLYMEREVMAAAGKDVTVIPIVVDDRAQLPRGLNRQAMHLSEVRDVDQAVGRIVDSLG